jgi:hypothetical protein
VRQQLRAGAEETMAKQREEAYYAATGEEEVPHCVVRGCSSPVVAEVHTDSYADALELFRGIRREKVHARRMGDERFFVCRDHLESDRRMAHLEWQWLMFT